MPRKRPPFIQIVNLNLSDDPDFGPYARGEADLPILPIYSNIYPNAFFYLGDIDRAMETSYVYSVYSEKEAEKREDKYDKIYHLFEAALYRSLAQRQTEAQKLWNVLVSKRRELEEKEMLQRRLANFWIYEAYALMKLGHYDEVVVPAQKGFDEICNGKGIHPAPHKNTKVYGLADVLIALANFKMNTRSGKKEQIQQTLVDYKKENVRYSRLGYGVIFDLQISYPDVFDPILPGSDQTQD